MGKYAVVARRSGSDWYVSMLNAGDKKQISLPIDFLKNRKGYTATLYYQASEEKKDVVDAKKIRLENRNEVIIDLVGNSGCVLHFSILNFNRFISNHVVSRRECSFSGFLFIYLLSASFFR